MFPSILNILSRLSPTLNFVIFCFVLLLVYFVSFSLTLGGFGVDRFYLGYWKEGLAKLFSFGGLGVWTLVDFILIAAQYVGPSDGSLYIF